MFQGLKRGNAAQIVDAFRRRREEQQAASESATAASAPSGHSRPVSRTGSASNVSGESSRPRQGSSSGGSAGNETSVNSAVATVVALNASAAAVAAARGDYAGRIRVGGAASSGVGGPVVSELMAKLGGAGGLRPITPR